jgi:hypothetical protein
LALVNVCTADHRLGPFVPLALTRQKKLPPFGSRSAVIVYVDGVTVTFNASGEKVALVETFSV